MKHRSLANLALLYVSFAAMAFCVTPGDERAALNATATHDYGHACDLYRKLTKEYPNNAEYWIWIGRLSGYLGQLEPALEAYNIALTLAPKDVDALVGKAYILLWEHKYDAARVSLERARELSPDSSDVNLAEAREYFYRNQPGLALSSIKRVLSSDTSNTEALAMKAVLAPPPNLTLGFEVTADHLPDASTGVSGAVEAGWISALDSASFRVEDWNRYGHNVFRAGLRGSHTFRHRWTVEGATLLGSRGDALPRWDNSLSLNRRMGSGWVLGGQYRELSFDGARVRLASPQVEYYFERPIWLDASYSRSWTSVNSSQPSQSVEAPANSFFVRYHQRIHRLLLHGGYGQGIQLFAIPASERLGQLKADTFVGGIDFPVSKSWMSHVEYLRENRSNGAVEQIVAAGLIYRRRNAP